MAKSSDRSSKMFIIYFLRFIARGLILLSAVYLYLFHRSMFISVLTNEFFHRFTPLHVIWFTLMLGMIAHLLPNTKITMSGLKCQPVTYREPEDGYDKLSLLEYVQAMNIRAWRVLLIWLCFNAVFGILCLSGIISNVELVMLSLCYYVCDLICMLFFCPFQKYMMGNRCCVNCRIFDWGHMMMYTPMIFIPGFFSWSLLFTALFVMIRWELVYARHPERFWRGSNDSIRCENCSDKMCRIKKPLVSEIDKIASSMPRPVDKLGISAEELDKEFED